LQSPRTFKQPAETLKEVSMMAKRADSGSVRVSGELPDYAKGITMLRDNVKTRKLRISGIQGEIGNVWDQIEKMGINKEGARIFLKLDDLQPSIRDDVLRTIQLMADASDWDKGDMIDQVQDNVVQMPGPGKGAATPAPPSAPSPKRESRKDKPPLAEGEDDKKVLSQADYKSVMAVRIGELSTLNETDAYKVANEIWTDLPNRDRDSKRTRANAIKNAEAEVDGWPEDTGAPAA
jgi:hypothetical protein